jgi:hypothetical protein
MHGGVWFSGERRILLSEASRQDLEDRLEELESEIDELSREVSLGNLAEEPKLMGLRNHRDAVTRRLRQLIELEASQREE